MAQETGTGDGRQAWSARVLDAGPAVLVAGLPLACAPWGHNPFELFKAALVWAAAAVLGAAWLAHFPHRFSRSHPDRAWILAVVASLGTLGISAIFSIDPLASAMGAYDRMQGALTLLSYAAIALIVAGEARGPAQMARLPAAAAWGSAPVVAYGLLQAAGRDPLAWQIDGPAAISTLGRANFLGAYLAMVLPLTLAAAWRTGGARRAAYGVLIAAQGACMAATGAQAAWLGAATAGGVLLLAAAWEGGHRRTAALGAVLGAVALIAAPAVLALLPGLEGSAGARSLIYRAAAGLAAARPLAGHGPETFAKAFTAVFPPELVYFQGRAVLVDRAHNAILDTLVSGGVLGLAAWAAVAGTALAAGARAFVRAPNRAARVTLAALLAAAAAHLAETQFSFPVTTTALLFWVCLGLLAGGATGKGPEGDHAGLKGHEGGRRVGFRHALSILGVLCVLGGSIVVVAADGYAGEAHRGTDLERRIAAGQRAAALWPYQAEYHRYLSWLYLEQGQFHPAEAELDAAARLAPGDYRTWAGYGELYLAWGQAGEKDRFAASDEAYRHATALFPGSAMLQTGWGLLYLAQDRPAEAAAHLHRAAGLDHTDAHAYCYLGDALRATGDLTGAEEAYRNAIRWQPEMAAAHRGLGAVYEQWGWPDTALRLYRVALALAPRDPDLYLDVARCHWDLAERQQACQVAAEGLLLEPGHPGLLAFQKACGGG